MIFVYADHEALKTFLTGLDNDTHGRIAKWEERLRVYDIPLLHRSAKTHFMAIADGLSRLPTHLLSIHVAEDTEGLRPFIGGVVPVAGLVVDVGVNGNLVVAQCKGVGFWQISGNGKGEYTEDGCTRIGQGEGEDVDRFVETLRLPEEEVGNKRGDGISWRNAVGDIKRRK